MTELEALIEAGPDHLKQVRQEALAKFRAMGWPDAHEESYRFTRLRPFIAEHFETDAPEENEGGSSVSFLDEPITVRFENGRVIYPELPAGVRIQNWTDQNERVGHPIEEKSPFRLLNTALRSSGACLQIEGEPQLPIYLQFSAQGSSRATHPRVMLRLAEGAHAQLIEHFVSTPGKAFTNAVIDIELGANSSLQHILIVQDGAERYHFRDARIHQDTASHYSGTYFHLAGHQARHYLEVNLEGAHAETELNALLLAKGQEQAENQFTVRHIAPSCKSRQQVQSIVDESGHTVFTGKVIVGEDAPKTDAGQSNRNLLLSSTARADAMPQLEIYTDDVACRHGSTTGNLDPEALFYLMARGLSRQEARLMLIAAFAHEIAGRVRLPQLRNWVDDYITNRFGGSV